MIYLVKFLLFIISLAMSTFWLMDILNMPFMEMFDTDIPLNGFFWILFALMYLMNVGLYLDIWSKKK